MSFQFWVNLSLALCFLLAAVLFINRTKVQFIRRIMASRLRQKILPRMEAVLAVISQGYHSPESETYPLFKLKADLEACVLKADVLFDIERTTLADFLTKLSAYIAYNEFQSVSNDKFDDLILCGQRVVNEINELK